MKKYFTQTLIVILTLAVTNSVLAQQDKTLSIYMDSEDGGSLWTPDGWMPNGEGILMNSNFTFEGEEGTCIETTFTPDLATNGWAGIYWLAGGSWKGPGINVYEYLEVEKDSPFVLTFRARGEKGGETVQFKVGGVTSGNDSVKFAELTKWIKLTTEWEQFEIDLSKKDVSNLVGAFCWVSSKVRNRKKEHVVFYIDDILLKVKK